MTGTVSQDHNEVKTGRDWALEVKNGKGLGFTNSFSSPELFVPLSRRGLGHEEQVALETHDLKRMMI